jgi:hypothetical protein
MPGADPEAPGPEGGAGRQPIAVPAAKNTPMKRIRRSIGGEYSKGLTIGAGPAFG